jgi:hypothetical protein
VRIIKKIQTPTGTGLEARNPRHNSVNSDM